MRRKGQRGQTLVEAVFVVVVVGFILSGLVAAIIYFARAARVAKYRSWATNLAQEKLEELRAEKERDPDSFWADLESHSGEEDLSPPEYPGEFSRKTTVESQGSNPGKAKVTVEVSWQDGSQTRSVTVRSYLVEND